MPEHASTVKGYLPTSYPIRVFSQQRVVPFSSSRERLNSTLVTSLPSKQILRIGRLCCLNSPFPGSESPELLAEPAGFWREHTLETRERFLRYVQPVGIEWRGRVAALQRVDGDVAVRVESLIEQTV